MRRDTIAFVAEPAVVRLNEPEFKRSYVVVERRPDGSLVLVPESVDAVVDAFADRVLDEAEQDEMFARLDAAADRSGSPGT
jgi:hypothetical protein